jgi:hypothetical protein
MAGTLEINSDAAWMPAGWIYDGVLKLLAEQLQDKDARCSSILREGLTSHGGFCDLSAIPQDTFRSLLRAAEAVHKETVEKGEHAFRDSSFYPAFVRQLGALIEILRSDRRVAGLGPTTTRLPPAAPSSAR